MDRKKRAEDGRAGRFVRQIGGYSAFIPNPLPPSPILQIDEELQSKIALAERQLGRLDSVATLVPDPDRFVGMYVRKEAVLSSQIEGTQASLSDILDYEAARDQGERSADVDETLNYVAALKHGLSLLESLPVSTRLLCEVHTVLMQNARGGESGNTPGAFRKTQNWIGGARPDNAVFVPPPAAEMQQAMGDLEKYLNDTSKATPLLIEIGLAHVQFETIHPFLDGNGRIGRLLITFLLTARGVLQKPLLYLSHYFKANRDAYYDRLQAVRTDGDWESWLAFFLDGVSDVAAEATDRARRIVGLRQQDQARIGDNMGARAHNALRLMEKMLEGPVVSVARVSELLEISQPTADKLLSDLVQLGILRETTGQSWGRRFAYQRYLDLFEK